MLLNSGQLKFLKNYRNVNDRALSKLITLLITNKKEFNHFFKSRSSDIVLLKLGNLNQNAKRYEAHNTEREARRPLGRALIFASEMSCARSARWERGSEASRFFLFIIHNISSLSTS